MASSIMTDWGDWDVRNLMFWKIFDLATEVGEQVADTDEKRNWVKALQELLQNQEKGSRGDPLRVSPRSPATLHQRTGPDGLNEFQRWGREGGNASGAKRRAAAK